MRYLGSLGFSTFVAVTFLTLPVLAGEQTAEEREVARHLRSLDRRVQALADEGDEAGAKALRERVTSLRRRLEDEFVPPESEAAEELHLVGFSQPSEREGETSIKVRVTAKGKPVVLAVCCYERATWTIEVAPGARVSRILIGGYHSQKLDSGPEGVPVEMFSYDDRQDRKNFNTSNRVDDSFNEASVFLWRQTGLDVTTFQHGEWVKDGEGAVVGPESAAWRAEMLLPEVRALERTALAPARAAFRESVSSVRFVGLRGRREVGTYSIAGVVSGSVARFDRDVRAVTWDGRDTCFAIIDSGIAVLDTATLTITPVDFGGAQVETPMALAFDEERGRLIVSAENGIFAYRPRTRRWTLIREWQTKLHAPLAPAGAVAFDRERDCLHVVGPDTDRSGPPRLVRLTATEGVPSRTKPLELELKPDPYYDHAQLVVLDRDVLLYRFAARRDGFWGRPEKTATWLIDRNSGEVLDHWRGD